MNRRRNKTGQTRKHGRSNWPRHWVAIALLALVYTLAAVLHVRSKLEVVQLGYRLSEATRERKRLLADSGKLRVEVATLRDPRRLRKLAGRTLGLREPTAEQVVRWKSKTGVVARRPR